jgi:hypothetical protein
MSALINVALNARLGMPAGIGESTIESDGRKAKRAMRDLIDAGLVAYPPKSSPHPDTYIVLIDVVLAYVLPAKPTLAVNDWQRSSIIEGRAPIGCKFSEFSQAEQLWMLTYPHEYRWQWVGPNEEIDWAPGKPLPDRMWHRVLMVSDQPLRDDLIAAQRAHKIAGLVKQNAGWALEKLVKLDEATVKTFMSAGSTGMFGGEGGFSGDTATWAETAKGYAERAQAKLKTAQAQLDAAQAVTAALATYGGWDKLSADLLIKIEAHLDGTDDSDDDNNEDK